MEVTNDDPPRDDSRAWSPPPTKPRHLTPRGVLSGLAASAAVTLGAALASRRRALASIPAPLRDRALYLPLSFTNTATVAIGRHLIPSPGTTVRPGMRVDKHTVAATATDPDLTVLTYQTPTRPTPSGTLVWFHGGGTILGSARECHALCSRVAAELDLLVLNVEY